MGPPRSPKEFAFSLETDDKDGVLYWARLVPHEHVDDDLGLKIMGAISENEGKGANEICSKVRVGRGRFYDELKRLKSEGKVVQKDRKRGLHLSQKPEISTEVPVPVQHESSTLLQDDAT